MHEAPHGGRRATALVVAASAALLGVLWLGFDLRHGCLLQGFDGNAWRIGFEVQREFRTPFTTLVADPMQGMFDAYFPAFREYLVPYLLTDLAGAGDPSKAFVYFTYSAIAMGATFALARVLGMSAWSGVLAGFLVPAATTPLMAQPILYPILVLNPHVLHAMALAVLVVACFWAMRRGAALANAALGACAVGFTLVIALGTVSLTALIVPAVAVYGGASLLDAAGWPDRVPRLVLAVALVAVPLALGIPSYAFALTKYTAYSEFSAEFLQTRANLGYASVVWTSIPWGGIVVAGGLAGAALAVRSGAARLRLFALIHMVTTILFHTAALAVVTLLPDYHGPSPLYFEFATWPISLMFLAYLVCAPFALPAVRRVAPALAAVPVLASGIGVAVASRVDPRACTLPYSLEPGEPNPIVQRLAKELRLAPGAPFRGFAATFAGDRPPEPSTWFTQHSSDFLRWRATANEMRAIGLWQFRVPTLFQYNTYITPVYYRLISNLFAQPGDRQMRSALVLTVPREPVLRVLGVRFLITDRMVESGQIRGELPVEGGDPVRLVELPEANLGDYSPVRTRVAGTAKEMLDVLAEATFDGRTEVVLEAPLGTDLVPARGARLQVVKDGLRLVAESPSRSLVVLPVQFSRCWEIRAAPPGARLVRANLAQLAVLFEGRLEADLQLRFGPFWNSGCRAEDIRDAERLEIGRTQGGRPS